MVTDKQVRLLRKKRMQGKTLEAAAVAAGMTEKTARKWERGALPSATRRPRAWRTRPDPFKDVWAAEVEPFLLDDKDGKLEAKTIFEELCRRHPTTFEVGQLRTLQRRVRIWRAEQGPEKEVFFPQEHLPGKMGAIDFRLFVESRGSVSPLRTALGTLLASRDRLKVPRARLAPSAVRNGLDIQRGAGSRGHAASSMGAGSPRARKRLMPFELRTGLAVTNRSFFSRYV